jgi:hypothetical protein
MQHSRLVKQAFDLHKRKPKKAAHFTKDQQAMKAINETAARQASAVKASLSTLEITYFRLVSK